jgi:putative transposase
MREAGLRGRAARRWKKTTIADPAAATRDAAPGVIFHSDRGCQGTSAAFAELAGDVHVELSLGRTGQCWDNALAESFFGSIKGELIDLQPWPARAAARRAVTEYIGWCNGTRLHSSLGYLSPAEFEATHRNEIRNVA